MSKSRRFLLLAVLAVVAGCVLVYFLLEAQSPVGSWAYPNGTVSFNRNGQVIIRRSDGLVLHLFWFQKGREIFLKGTPDSYLGTIRGGTFVARNISDGDIFGVKGSEIMLKKQ